MFKLLSIGLVVTLGLAGCASPALTPRAEILQGETTRSVQIKGIVEVSAALSCIRDAGTYRNMRAAVTPWADGTGKANFVTAGGPNGHFLPQGTTASFATHALRRAGLTVIDLYSMAGEQNLRQMGTPQLAAAYANLLTRNEPHFMVNGSWLSFDIDNSVDANVQVGGVGPIVSTRGAKVSMGVEIVKPGSRVVIGQSILKRNLFSVTLGGSVARVFGTELATGEVRASSQQPIQLESAEYMVALGVAEALVENPAVPERCRTMVSTLLGRTPAPGQVPAPATAMHAPQPAVTPRPQGVPQS
ncbi:MAG: hypothetical protein INF43_03725 [Alphaproteobacteria bacterium]|jgi:hypothetical protein|nr:hypothetical protein [Alphaproteobacteria bacterium]